MLDKFKEKASKWNWSVFWFCVVIGGFGALTNSNFKTIHIALAVGIPFGALIGLVWAVLSRE